MQGWKRNKLNDQSVDKKRGVDKVAGQPAKKKALGQHFLIKASVVENMLNAVNVGPEHTVMEIGCGDGFLTSMILSLTSCKRLLCFEIDPAWIGVVKQKLKDPRLTIKHRDILDVDWAATLSTLQPLVLLANLPYQITFPILQRIAQHKALFQEGVIMIQDEVAEKLLATRGRAVGQPTLFFQHHFEIKSVEKIGPEAFSPSPNVVSRTIYFKPRFQTLPVDDEPGFWTFVKTCFGHPRQTLKNNLRQAGWLPEHLAVLSQQLVSKRAGELPLDELIRIFKAAPSKILKQ